MNMGRRVVIALGSPRKNGNSTLLAGQAEDGAVQAGARVEVFHLQDMDIRPCTGCDRCQGSMDEECIIDDDMRTIDPVLRRAQGLIIASPIYWFTFSAQTKLFMDRWYALGGPGGHALRDTRIGIILTYAGEDPFVSGAVNALRTLQDVFSHTSSPIVGRVYGSCLQTGEISKNEGLMKQAFDLGEKVAGK